MIYTVRPLSQHDLLETLHVKDSASNKEIKHAYLKLAKKYHPDVNKQKDAAKTFA